MEDKGLFDLASELKASIVNVEELADADWVPVTPKDSHWTSGELSSEKTLARMRRKRPA
jgi:hypothetical protein